MSGRARARSLCAICQQRIRFRNQGGKHIRGVPVADQSRVLTREQRHEVGLVAVATGPDERVD